MSGESETFDWRPLEVSTQSLTDTLADLRAGCPVPFGQVPGLQPFYSLLRYDDVVRAARDTQTYSNSNSRLQQRRVPLESDPPEHGQIRRLLQHFFLPSALRQYAQISRQYAQDLVPAFIASSGGDAMEAIARVLPPQVLLALLGQPREEWSNVKQWSEQSYLQMSQDPAAQAQFRSADRHLWDYARSIVEGRAREPGDPSEDLVSAMLFGRSGAEPMDTDLVIGAVRVLLAAGHDSTTSSLGICIEFLANDPALQARLRADPGLIPAAVEEILRLRSPVVMMPRTVTRDVEVCGR